MRALVSQHGCTYTLKVLDSLHKLWAERREDIVTDISGAVVLLVIVASTIRLLLSEAATALPHVGSVLH
jgi:hypothetical protein